MENETRDSEEDVEVERKLAGMLRDRHRRQGSDSSTWSDAELIERWLKTPGLSQKLKKIVLRYLLLGALGMIFVAVFVSWLAPVFFLLWVAPTILGISLLYPEICIGLRAMTHNEIVDLTRLLAASQRAFESCIESEPRSTHVDGSGKSTFGIWLRCLGILYYLPVFLWAVVLPKRFGIPSTGPWPFSLKGSWQLVVIAGGFYLATQRSFLAAFALEILSLVIFVATLVS